VSSSENPDVRCPDCRTINVWFAEICTSCGTSLAGSSLEGSIPQDHPHAEGGLQDTETQCHDCGALNSGLAQFCTSCGAALAGGTSENDGPSGNLSTKNPPQDNGILCPSCGTGNAKTSQFCTSCGSSLAPTTFPQDSTTSESQEGGVGQPDYAKQSTANERTQMGTQNSSNDGSALARVGFIIAIIAIIGFAIGFVPCFGWFNCFNIPFAIVGLIINVVVMARGNNTARTPVAIGLCVVAIVIGGIRWVAGGFIV
jgi:DNA-directed RNA polymerase subunit RPC12/RpoP